MANAATTVSKDASDKAKPRKLKQGSYKSFTLQKRIRTAAPIPGAFHLFWNGLQVLRRHWVVFSGIVLVYALLNVLLVQGINSVGNLEEAKQTVTEAYGDQLNGIGFGVTLFAHLVSTSGSALSPAAGAYQLILALIMSIVLIWTLREVYAGHKVRIRDGFYKGVYPLVTFVLVLCVIALQLLPLLFGGMLYNLVAANGIAITGMEQILWVALFFFFSLISLYMMSSSLFALYIVCLPGMTPIRALSSARELVRNRRWTVMRKVIFLPIALLVIAAVIIVPLILLAAPLAVWVFFILSMCSLAVIHSYLYALYRSLL